MSLTVIGTVALDTVESPFGKIQEGLGGSATHFSAAATFFTPVSLVAVIGEDFPKVHIDFLKSLPINVEGLQQLPGKSFRWKGRYDYDLNTAHTLETQLNVLTEFKPVLPDGIQANPFVFLANIDPRLQAEVLDQVKGKPFVAADTMNFWIEGARSDLLKVLPRVDMLIINEGEARLLSQEHNLVKACRAIRKMGAKVLLIKQGEYGALAFYEDQVFSAPGLPLEDIQDPTGAGDSFAGGVMGYLTKIGTFNFEHLKQAVIYGSVMASFNVEKFSLDRLKTLTLDEIQERYAQFRRLAHFEDITAAA
jgi:sugar/nucleoside kinase (ribokinase family)